MREIINKVKEGYSIALMVDQRVSEGPRIPFFNKLAHTTTIPAQLALKYNCKLVPISLERKEGPNFEMTIHEPYQIEKTGNDEEDSKNITLKINQIIEEKVRPAVARDGGDIIFNKFEDGVVYISMRGSCDGCPASTMTLKNGVENLLKHYAPEVESVVPLQNE